ncbi:MAG TPA: MarR family transcriptional regulator [Acidimicrobiales bacterium]|nr:MarR family transcriptional regulator [Acidimicrobiales bacterium]
MDEAVNNLVGTFGLAVGDAVNAAVAEVAGHAGAMAAGVSYLYQEPDCGIEDLRAPLGLSQPAAVRLVNQLVEAGLARRADDERDARRVCVRLTERGRALARRILAARREAVDRMLGPLSERDQRLLTDLVSTMLAGVTADRADAERLCRLCDVPACGACPVEAAVPDDAA